MCLWLGDGYCSRHHEERGDQNDDGAERPELHIVLLQCGLLQRTEGSWLPHLCTYSRRASASDWVKVGIPLTILANAAIDHIGAVTRCGSLSSVSSRSV